MSELKLSRAIPCHDTARLGTVFASQCGSATLSEWTTSKGSRRFSSTNCSHALLYRHRPGSPSWQWMTGEEDVGLPFGCIFNSRSAAASFWSPGGEVKMWTRWPRRDKAVWSVCACRSIPPGVVPMGHFLEKTAILRMTGGRRRLPPSSRLFQANSAPRRSPVQGPAWEEKVLEMEVEGA